MSDRYDSYPPDEPVIGDSYPPGIGYPAAPAPVIGAVDTVDTGYTDEIDMIGGYDVIGADDAETIIGDDTYEAEYDAETIIGDDTYETEYDDEIDYDDESYYGDYDDEINPARQPIFYVFLGIAVLVGGIFIFLLYSLFAGGEENGSLPTTSFNIVIDQPIPNERIATGADMTIAVRANASEPLVKFELFIQDRAVESAGAQPPVGDAPYSASFTWRFNSKGEYTIFVRATSESGATKDSEKVRVVAFEGPGDRPVSITGRVVASVSMRTGPGDDYEAVGTLTAGQTVRIIGKTRDASWLLIENDGGRWVKRQAIEVDESLALVPVKEPTPVPEPTATNTPDPSPSPTATPTVNPTAPDFKPMLAQINGKTLRVTIANSSNNNYAGPLVVAVGGTVPVREPKKRVFDVDIPANGTIIVEFDLTSTPSGKTSAQIRVDPDNAIMELNEDDNEMRVDELPAPGPAPSPSPSPSPSDAVTTTTTVTP